MKLTWKKALSGIAALAAFLYWQDNGLMITKYHYYSKKLPKIFSGYKILQISDLQNKEFGAEHKKILSAIEKQKPDCIVITGDLLDRNRTNIKSAIQFIANVVKLAPVYYVSGNHEHQSGAYDIWISFLKEHGVFVLENEKQKITKDSEYISILGLKDKSVNPQYKQILSDLSQEQQSQFQILLSHRPELLCDYAENPIDIVFTGHAHGGQIRIPFVGGIFAPHQGFFPKYTSGMHTQKNTSMVISRGLGNSTFPFRIHNRPELVVVTLLSIE